MIQTVREPRLVKIRRQRECFTCLRQFPAGEKMYIATYSEDVERQIWNSYHCLQCQEFLDNADNEMIEGIQDDTEIYRGGIREFLHESGGFAIDQLEQFFEYWEEEKKK